MGRGPAVLAAISLAACGIDAVGLATDAGGGTTTGTTSGPDAATPNDGGLSDDGSTIVVVDDAEAGPPPVPKPAIFLSNTSELWKFEPVAKTFSKVGDFTSCNGGVEEIAVDANGTLVATRDDNGALYMLGGANNATCTATVSASMPFALTFAPKGTLQANADTLVGFTGDGSYVKYDRTTGASSVVKSGALGGYRPRGDVTFGAGGKGYVAAVAGDATVSCPTDCLVEVSLTTGDVLRKVTEFPSGEVYAIAFSNGKVHGFASNAKVDIVTLEPFGVETITPPNGTPSFRGGGASTAGF